MVRRGEVYWAELAPRSGAEQSGYRPVVIVSNDGFNQAASWRSLIVVPVSTSESQAKRGPSTVFLASGSAGLERDSVVVCHQITTLDRSKLKKRSGELSAVELKQVEAGIKAALELL